MNPQQRVAFTVWNVVVFVVFILLSGCMSFPPQCPPNPRVVVDYKCAMSSSGSNEVIFFKKVTQVIDRPYRYGNFLMGEYWGTIAEEAWSKWFICTMNTTTKQKKVIREWPRDLCPPDKYRVSRSLRQVVILCQGDVAILNLDTLSWRFLNLKRKCPNWVPALPGPEMSPDEREFAIKLTAASALVPPHSKAYGVAICDFDGNIRTLLGEEEVRFVYWMQKSNLLRIWYATRWATVSPRDFSVVEEANPLERPRSGELSPDECRPPLDALYGTGRADLGQLEQHNGEYQISQAAGLW